MFAADEMLRTAVLGDAAPVIIWIWLAHTIKRLKAPPPSLTNFDGEQVVLRKSDFRSRKRAGRRWRGSSMRYRNSRANGRNFAGAGIGRIARRANRKRTAVSRSRVGMKQEHWCWAGLMRGTWLVLEVNSLARADRGRQKFTQLLDGLAGMPVTETIVSKARLSNIRGV